MPTLEMPKPSFMSGRRRPRKPVMIDEAAAFNMEQRGDQQL